jgi:hypothetical protein
MSDEGFGKLLGAIVLLVVVEWMAAHEAETGLCTPKRAGALRTGYHGGPVEVCDGSTWKPARMEVGP